MGEGRITQVESFGFERIPDASRHARPIDLFRLLFGGCNTFSPSVLGSFPVPAGLAFVSLPGQFVGPLGNLAGGLDLSVPVPVSLAVGGMLYFVLLTMYPEPDRCGCARRKGNGGGRTLRIDSRITARSAP